MTAFDQMQLCSSAVSFAALLHRLMQARQDELLGRQGMTVAMDKAVDGTPMDIQPSAVVDDKDIKLADAVSLQVVQPAGGQVVRGGAGVLGIVLTQAVVAPATTAASAAVTTGYTG